MNTKDVLAAIDLSVSSLEALKRILNAVILPDPEPPGIIALPKETNAELNAFYGTATNRGNNLGWFDFPVNDMRLYSRQGADMQDHNGNEFDDHRCNVKIATRLTMAYKDLYDTLGKDRFYEEGWHVYSGCFNYRTKRGGSSLSTHSWGIAVDINGAENPFHSSSHTLSDDGINIMEKHGFLSGGRAWGKDFMHFQSAIPYISAGSYYDKHGIPNHIKEA